MISIQQESYAWCMKELSILYQDHYKEIYPDTSTQLNPQFTRYIALEQANVLLLLTIRDKDRLIGYIQCMIMPDLHTGQLCCYEDAYYITPKYRKAWLGITLFKTLERILRQLGVTRVTMTTPTLQDKTSIFTRLGYTFSEKVFTKEIQYE